MIKRLTGFALVLLVGVLCLISTHRQAVAEDVMVFELSNKTGYEITKIYLAPHSSADWDRDDELLRGKVFKDGHTVEVTYHLGKRAPSWDLRVSWATGDPDTEWQDLHLKHGGHYALHYDKDKDETSISND